ncbi:Signal transduction histidine kinase [Streptomyces sp. 3213]|uniref:sensor histidine kinase n=1 Tax=Streptomyces sp. 3213.3 TaxID=1855348 RepID=UPI00089D019B|nr:histidine kinase [Streptomyces sp. 3213.3]SEC73037.1 Signal transduction histidine kinase [Streptomyces sp. 3213] [Streptomyces sp. 3213.3]
MTPRRPPAPWLDAALLAAALLDVWVHVDPGDRIAMTCALLGAFSLVLRHRLPLLTYLLALPATFVTDSVFATLAALYTLASLSRRRVLLAGCAAVFTVGDTTAWSWPVPEFADPTDASTLITITYSLATATAPVFLGQLVQARRELGLRLTEITEAREHERRLLAQNVLAKERAQLAREMHDVVSHQVSLIAVRAGALQVGNRDPETKEAAADIRRLAVRTLDELRHMVGVLRAAGSRPTELTPQPLLADLPQLVDGSGIEAELRAELPQELPPAVQRAVYRTVQEALTNIRKHAPGSRAAIRIGQQDGTVHVVVVNSAPQRPALPLPGSHHGLVGLRQRAELLGGSVSAGPTADGGYELRLEFPVRNAS